MLLRSPRSTRTDTLFPYTTLFRSRIGAVPVMADDGVAGVFSERDVIMCLAREGASALDRSVGEVMTAPAVTVASHDRALAALSLMTRRRIRHLPVIDGGHLIGLVSLGDLVKRSEKHTSELH